jgi:branched-chain amino acid transport system substrate-binding protein
VIDGTPWVATAGGLARAAAADELASTTTRGAGRDGAPRDAAPATIGIGIMRPGERMITIPGSPTGTLPRLGTLDRMAALLAVEQANARGGRRAVPYELVTGPTGSFRGWGWTTPEDDLVAIALRPDAVAVVASISAGAGFTTAVTARTDLPVVNCATEPAGPDETASPWIVRGTRDRARAHRAVLDHVLDGLGCARPAVLRTGDPAEARWLEVWIRHARRRGHPVVVDVSGEADLDAALEHIRRADAQIVLTWCDAAPAAAILRAMRDAGMDQVLVGSDALLDPAFTGLAGPEPGAVVAAADGETDRPRADRFAADYRARFRRPPAPGAIAVFDAVSRLIETIETAGTDRAAVRDAMRASEDAAGGPVLAQLVDGAWQLLP